MRAPLPIDTNLPEIASALRARSAVVLVAPTGSGKTTRVAPALLDLGIAPTGTVIVVQPRRVAARLAARRIALERGGRIGDEVGYRVRFESRVSARTRIEVVTEGLLLRRLLADPFLEGVAAVVLDEFHERSLDGDVALALLREIRGLGRDDLAVVVMSATLDPDPIAAFLDAAVVRSEGRAWPVELRYDARTLDTDPVRRVAAAVRVVLDETAAGHVLAFRPGAGDSARVAEALHDLTVPVWPLHGALSAEAQDAALAPSPQRKVVLATNIAETSVTLEGVRAVVDSGLEKEASFDPSLGLVRLVRGPISRASADQRAGRAGRTGPGLCRRLWTAADHARRPEAPLPEIRRADLTETVLLLRAWGAEPRALRWLEPPEDAALERAERLLARLGALHEGALTPLGHTLARLPVHPRLGRVIVAGHEGGFLTTAATVAALTEERDPFPDADRLPAGDDDLDRRLRALAATGGHGGHPAGVRRVLAARDQLVAAARRALGPPSRDGASPPGALVRALLDGFPDRVGRAGSDRRVRLAEGGGAELDAHSAARGAPWILAVGVEAGARGPQSVARIHTAVPVDLATLPVASIEVVTFDADREAVVRFVERRYGTLVLDTVPADGPGDPARVARALAEAALADPSRALGGLPELEGWLARLALLRANMPELGLPDLDPTALLPELCMGLRSFSELRRLDLREVLAERLGHHGRAALSRHAPERVTVPSGAQMRVTYSRDAPPFLAARIQQLFGLATTPTIAGGRVRLTMHLLSPANRPVQVTTDLQSFWERTWPEVRKDLRGRYPKHDWPEDPWNATPTDRAKRRGPGGGATPGSRS